MVISLGITWILDGLEVTILHGLWDGLAYTVYVIVPPGFPLPVTSLALGVVGIVTLSVLYRQAMIQQMQ